MLLVHKRNWINFTSAFTKNKKEVNEKQALSKDITQLIDHVVLNNQNLPTFKIPIYSNVRTYTKITRNSDKKCSCVIVLHLNNVESEVLLLQDNFGVTLGKYTNVPGADQNMYITTCNNSCFVTIQQWSWCIFECCNPNGHGNKPWYTVNYFRIDPSSIDQQLVTVVVPHHFVLRFECPLPGHSRKITIASKKSGTKQGTITCQSIGGQTTRWFLESNGRVLFCGFGQLDDIDRMVSVVWYKNGLYAGNDKLKICVAPVGIIDPREFDVYINENENT